MTIYCNNKGYARAETATYCKYVYYNYINVQRAALSSNGNILVSLLIKIRNHSYWVVTKQLSDYQDDCF
jgi:hypothetical protein